MKLSTMYPGQQNASRAVGSEMVSNLTKQERLDKRGLTVTLNRAANLLANLVFVMLVLLLFVWIGLWSLVD